MPTIVVDYAKSWVKEVRVYACKCKHLHENTYTQTHMILILKSNTISFLIPVDWIHIITYQTVFVCFAFALVSFGMVGFGFFCCNVDVCWSPFHCSIPNAACHFDDFSIRFTQRHNQSTSMKFKLIHSHEFPSLEIL